MLHHSKPARLTVPIAIGLLFGSVVSCTPEQVTEGATKIGVIVNAEQAQAISDRLTAARPEMVELASYTPAPVITEEQARAIAWTAAVASAPAPLSIADQVRAQWAGTGHEERAVRVARCESGLRADPPHNNPHYGVFQMGRSEFARFGTGSIFNAADNIAAAFRYWDYGNGVTGDGRGSWGPWACKG